MLLRSSISSTKKFIWKSLQSFKSFFRVRCCEDELYQKLPKASPYYNNPMMNPQNYQYLDNFYTEFTHRWDSQNGKAKKRNKNTTTTTNINNKNSGGGDDDKKKKIVSAQFTTQRREDIDDESKPRSCAVDVEKKQGDGSFSKSFTVAKKLKEIEIMDVNNVDHVLDIEEIIYYYSRLTCPAYVDVVDKFFMEICSEFLGERPGSPTSVDSRPKFRSLRH